MWFYISFASHARGHLGSTVVEASDEKNAIGVATARGINPGGEAMIQRITKKQNKLPIIESLRYRLLSKEELKVQGAVRIGRLKSAAYACELCNTGVPHEH